MPCPRLLWLLVLLSQEACPSTFCCPLLLAWAEVSFGHRPVQDNGVSTLSLSFFSKMGLVLCSGLVSQDFAVQLLVIGFFFHPTVHSSGICRACWEFFGAMNYEHGVHEPVSVYQSVWGSSNLVPPSPLLPLCHHRPIPDSFVVLFFINFFKCTCMSVSGA